MKCKIEAFSLATSHTTLKIWSIKKHISSDDYTFRVLIVAVSYDNKKQDTLTNIETQS